MTSSDHFIVCKVVSAMRVDKVAPYAKNQHCYRCIQILAYAQFQNSDLSLMPRVLLPCVHTFLFCWLSSTYHDSSHVVISYGCCNFVISRLKLSVVNRGKASTCLLFHLQCRFCTTWVGGWLRCKIELWRANINLLSFTSGYHAVFHPELNFFRGKVMLRVGMWHATSV